MRKITKILFTITLLFFTSATLSFGQIMFGPRIGLNLSTLVGENVDVGFKPGLHIGGYVRIGGEKVAFQPEVLFSMKGYVYKEGIYSERQSLNYVDVPLLVAFGSKFKFLLGVQPSILLGAKYKFKSGPNSSTSENKDSFNTLDLAGVLGFEFELNNGLNFGYRFGLGFMPILEADGASTILNMNMQVTVGYTIGKD